MVVWKAKSPCGQSVRESSFQQMSMRSTEVLTDRERLKRLGDSMSWNSQRNRMWTRIQSHSRTSNAKSQLLKRIKWLLCWNVSNRFQLYSSLSRTFCSNHCRAKRPLPRREFLAFMRRRATRILTLSPSSFSWPQRKHGKEEALEEELLKRGRVEFQGRFEYKIWIFFIYFSFFQKRKRKEKKEKRKCKHSKAKLHRQ